MDTGNAQNNTNSSNVFHTSFGLSPSQQHEQQQQSYAAQFLNGNQQHQLSQPSFKSSDFPELSTRPSNSNDLLSSSTDYSLFAKQSQQSMLSRQNSLGFRHQALGLQDPTLGNPSPTPFSIQNEDFPALPSNAPGTGLLSINQSRQNSTASIANHGTSKLSQLTQRMDSFLNLDDSNSVANENNGEFDLGMSMSFGRNSSSSQVQNIPGPMTAAAIKAQRLQKQQAPMQQARSSLVSGERFRMQGLMNIKALTSGSRDRERSVPGLLSQRSNGAGQGTSVSKLETNVREFGMQLDSLKLDIASKSILFRDPSFHSPFMRDISAQCPIELPSCYAEAARNTKAILGRGSQGLSTKRKHFSKFTLSTLFFVFYNYPRDILQLLAAEELYNRQWKFHEQLKMWFLKPIDEALEEVSGPGETKAICFDTRTFSRTYYPSSQAPVDEAKFLSKDILDRLLLRAEEAKAE